MAGPELPIEAPPRERRLGGIADVASFRRNERLGAAEGIVYQSNGCTFPSTEELRCYADPTPPDKESDGIDIEFGIGKPFTIYGSVKCKVGPDPDEVERAQAILELGQDRMLEDELETWAAGGTALTAGANIVESVARVEQALDSQYLARGVIAMSRYDAVLAKAAGAIDEDEATGKLQTINKTPVFASGFFSIGTVYGLGSIVVEHSDPVVNETVDLSFNQHYGLAEAVFAIAVDCEFRVKSTITAP
jgi:hypothetical protein